MTFKALKIGELFIWDDRRVPDHHVNAVGPYVKSGRDSYEDTYGVRIQVPGRGYVVRKVEAREKL